MKSLATATVVALVLTACTTEVVVPAEEPTTSSSPTSSASATPSASPSASASESTTPAPVNTVQPGTAAPGSVAALDVMSLDELGAALIAVDDDTGTVSWWDGFDWQSFDVDAALTNQGWATDGHGGLLVQDEAGNIWHVEPYTDDPNLVVEAPPEGSDVFSSLVGGGIIDGRQYAYVEQATYDTPETATGSIIGFDIDGRADRTLLTNTAGWESGTGEVDFAGNIAVLTVHAECWTGVMRRQIGDDGNSESIAAGIDCQSAISTVGTFWYGGPAAFAVVESLGADLPATMVVRGLDEFEETIVTALPRGDQPWWRVTTVGSQAVVSADGVVIAQDDSQNWRRLEVTVPGVVAVADDLAIG